MAGAVEERVAAVEERAVAVVVMGRPDQYRLGCSTWLRTYPWTGKDKSITSSVEVSLHNKTIGFQNDARNYDISDLTLIN